MKLETSASLMGIWRNTENVPRKAKKSAIPSILNQVSRALRGPLGVILYSHDRERPYSTLHSLAGGLLQSETYSPSSNKATGVEACWEKVTQDICEGLGPQREWRGQSQASWGRARGGELAASRAVLLPFGRTNMRKSPGGSQKGNHS